MAAFLGTRFLLAPVLLVGFFPAFTPVRRVNYTVEATRVGFKTDFDPVFIEKILMRAASRVPVFENLAVNPKRAWAGLYEMAPDHHPILGPVPQVPGFFLANGFSGHGVMHAPATGRILSDLILQGTTDLVDSSLLSLSRFSEGRMIEETAVL